VIAAPVFVGVLVTLGHLASIRHPSLGWAQTVASDAKAVSFGDSLYGDPSTQYTGMFYTPLYPVILAPLYRVLWWDGWPILTTIIAGLVLALTTAIIAASGPARDRRDRCAAVVGGVGVGGIAWWVVSTNYRNLLYDGRADQMAWCLAILGLCVLALGVSRPPARLWPAVALLSAAVWTKQTTVGAIAAAGIAVTWWMVRGAVSRRTWVRFGTGLIVLNATILGILQVASKGWAWYYLIAMPGKHYRSPEVEPYVREFRNLVIGPAMLLLIPSLALASQPIVRLHRRVWPWMNDVALDLRRVASRRQSNERRNVPPFTLALGGLLVAFIVVSFIPAWAGRRKQGGEANQYIGIMWALGFLLALVHRAARGKPRALAACVVAYCVLIAAVHLPSLSEDLTRRSIAITTTYPAVTFQRTPMDLQEYASTHRVYHPFAGDLSAQALGELWPTEQNVADLLAAGESPGYLVDALIDRRFDAVVPFDPSGDLYASAYGRTEENFFWKLNRVIEYGYEPTVGGVPSGLWRRKPGSPDISWLRDCFGPFDVGATSWVIRKGGGLWCASDTSHLRLVETPAPVTEIRSARDFELRGWISVDLPSSTGTVEIVADASGRATTLTITAHPEGDATRIVVTTPDGITGGRTVPSSLGAQGVTRRVALADGTVGETPGLALGGRRGSLSIRASKDSQARIGFDELGQ
jgi:hypothetical protein